MLEKETDPKKIPYCMVFNDKAPQYAVLCYLKQGEVIRENFKIENDGFRFHESHFVNLNELLSFFKKNLHTPDYINHLNSAKDPYIGVIIDEEENANLAEGYSIGKLES